MEDLRKAIAYRDYLKVLQNHVTRVLYDSSRADVLKLISRKISYKEHLITRQDSEFTEQLNKSITSVEAEISVLIAFIQAFDHMAEFMQSETSIAVDEWWNADRKNLILSELLNAQTERAESWSNTAFSLHDHILTIGNA